ncbi:MAG: glycogen debranching enzyme GlgX, partial [Alphaproteobacteria bacterium]|nr:glycogen debranching enzyme GlgX [Alphaproteobacteria bacterium]
MGAKLKHGSPYPLGATWDGHGANFALFSETAHVVELCLFDARGQRETARLALPCQTDGVWHGYLPDAQPGQLYGYRVHGPYAPEEGHRFNPNKLLVDPYAKGLYGKVSHHDANYAFDLSSSHEDLSFDDRDNAAYMPKCILTSQEILDGGRAKPATPWS